MPPKLTPEKAEKYKNRDVGKYASEDVKKGVHQFPTELKGLGAREIILNFSKMP